MADTATVTADRHCREGRPAQAAECLERGKQCAALADFISNLKPLPDKNREPES
ncbi:MAG: hypothetical protein V4726_11185 [Verrucomicrobiota bacterium]